jgi:hypothetical protein
MVVAVSAAGGTLDQVAAPPFKDGPPARVSGGFGEETCWACHFDNEENDPSGTLVITGVPDRFSPGGRYELILTLSRPGMAVGGFQLTARVEEDGTQAGELEPGPGEEARIGVLTERDVQYVHHLLPGVELTADGQARWRVIWTAPSAAGSVLFHAAAVAGDGDESQIGDFVYTGAQPTRRTDP